jgi:hypothetical protein
MDVRLQRINNDTVLEITQNVLEKTRYSESDLLRQKAYFESMVTKGQEGLDRVNALLTQIENEKLK